MIVEKIYDKIVSFVANTWDAFMNNKIMQKYGYIILLFVIVIIMSFYTVISFNLEQ